jgi:signal transduction histidine kinase
MPSSGAIVAIEQYGRRMSWVTIIYAAMGGIAVTLAGIYLAAWLLLRRDATYFAFVTLAASAAGLAGAELWMMKAQTPQEFGEALRWYHVPIWTGFCSFAALVYLRLRPRFVWIGWLAVALRTASLVPNFASATNLNYTVMTGISQVQVLGESVTLAAGEPNPWMLIGQASQLLALLFVIDGGVSAWRRGGPDRPLWLVIGLLALISIGTIQAVLVFWEVVEMPMLITPLFLLTAMAMAHELSFGLLRAERAERELAAKDAALLRSQLRLAAMEREENAILATEVERQTEALRRTSAQAQASSEAKSRFLSSASHELRAPLHDLLGYAQLLSREIPAEAQGHLAVIQKSGKQLLQLIDDILEFSRGDAKPMVLDRAPVSLVALAAHLEATCAPMAARGGNRFETRILLASADWVIADERRLIQVLRNLIDNACKYTRDGVVEASIGVVARTDGKASTDEPLIRFSVSDTGIGIHADQQQAVFEPFKRLDRYERAPGLGLGLTISQQIVDAMGGRIQVQSRPERVRGSLFSFELRMPRADTAVEDASGYSGRAILGYRGRPRTILIVDDRASSRRMLAERCELLGFEVLEAGNGLEALERLCAATARPDLALVDQFMPELDGWGLLRRVRASARDRDMPMVLISAAPVQPPDDLPIDVLFDEEALKPLSVIALTSILQRHLDLVWEYAEPDPAGMGASAHGDFEPSIELPPGCCDLRLAQLNEMLSLGAIVAIEQWAAEMLEQHPDHAAVWAEVQRRAARVDLAGLRELTWRLQAKAAGAGRRDDRGRRP